MKVLFGFIFVIILAFSCKQDANRSNSGREESSVITRAASQSLAIVSPAENESFALGTDISLNYTFRDSSKKADSVVYRLNGKRAGQQNSPFQPFTWKTQQELPGQKNITVTAYYGDSAIENRHVKISLLSDIKPQLYTYQVIHTYPHDKNAYTQGLLFEDGVLYEGTGQTGQSTLRKVKLETGERIKVLNLPPDMFGEGIASVGQYLYQITYKNNVAFQYDKNTFELITRFTFPMNEGWGLTYNGKYLLMTDGTENIYSLDVEYFTEVKRIEVYDDKGPVKNLNELEYINNEIWANVYTTDTIVRIEPETGKVTGKISIQGILKEEDYHTNIDYLNGIAHDKQNNRLFITGKNWPKLFEIRVVEK